MQVKSDTQASPPPRREEGPRRAAWLEPGQLVLAAESASDFATFRQQIESRFALDGPLADCLIGQLASVLWRLRRSASFEAGLLSWIAHQQAQSHDRSGIGVGDLFFAGDHRGLDRPTRIKSRPTREQLDRSLTGRTAEVAFGKNDLLGRLGRYEAHLMRQAERILSELRRIKAEGSAASVKQPAVGAGQGYGAEQKEKCTGSQGPVRPSEP